MVRLKPTWQKREINRTQVFDVRNPVPENPAIAPLSAIRQPIARSSASHPGTNHV